MNEPLEIIPGMLAVLQTARAFQRWPSRIIMRPLVYRKWREEMESKPFYAIAGSVWGPRPLEFQGVPIYVREHLPCEYALEFDE